MPKDMITPIRRQYLEIKKQYPHAILFFRLGDFYETFDEDAKITARELDIVLTSRNVAKGVRVPMAGIPHHAVENYLARLIDRGYHVAICEQVGDQPVRGLFPRQVTRVITPGTLLEPALLPAEANNYLVSLFIDLEDHPSSEGKTTASASIAYVDISTGEFAVTELKGTDVLNAVRAELERLRPAEVLHPESLELNEGIPWHRTPLPDWRFEVARCQEVLQTHFGVASLEGFGLRDFSLSVRTAGGILQYLSDTQSAALSLLTKLSTYSLDEFMVLDAATRRNLELTETLREARLQGSLLAVLDYTSTPMGKRLLRQWVNKPLLDVSAIYKRQQGVELFFTKGILRQELRGVLRSLSDLERLVNRVLSGFAQPRDLVSMRQSLQSLPGLFALIQEEGETLQDILQDLNLCSDELDLLNAALADDPPPTLQSSGVIRPGYSGELDDILERSRHAREWIASLESVERKRTGIKSLKVGYNKVFGYYLEVTKANADQVPPEYIRKQTLVNAERYITPELKEYETLVLNAEERIREIEARLFRQVCQQLGASAGKLLKTARALAVLDAYISLAEAASRGGYVKPVVVEEDVLEIHQGRHPVVEQTLKGKRFVPNDVVFEEGERIRIITGPNMSGKSTLIRQVALIVLLAQIGSFVPAESARLGVVDRIFTRIGAQDEIYAGQSTFMVEMVETANILHHATPRSLIVLDEIGRGTSTYDGVSIAWAVVEYLHNHPQLRAKTLFATHYHELTQLAEVLPGVRNYNVAVSEADGQVVFLYRIVPGGADKSYGIHVGQLAGLPRPVVQRASEILKQLESSSGKAVKIKTNLPQQLAFFPETNPLLEDLRSLDLNTLAPIEALNRLYEWQRKYLSSPKEKKD